MVNYLSGITNNMVSEKHNLSPPKIITSAHLRSLFRNLAGASLAYCFGVSKSSWVRVPSPALAATNHARQIHFRHLPGVHPYRAATPTMAGQSSRLTGVLQPRWLVHPLAKCQVEVLSCVKGSTGQLVNDYKTNVSSFFHRRDNRICELCRRKAEQRFCVAGDLN